MGGCGLVLEDDQDVGADAVVVDGPVRCVVAQVRCEALGHRHRPHGAALPLQKEGPGDAVLAQHAEGVGVDGAAAVAVPEVPGGPPGRVELDYFPAGEGRLLRQGRHEGVDGGRVLDVPEQLAAPAARHAAPAEARLPHARRHAPPFLRHTHRGAVPAGQHREPPVGEGEASAPGNGPGDETEAFQGVDQFGGPLGRYAQQCRQVLEDDPRPVRDKVGSALLAGLEVGGEHVVEDVPGRTRHGGIGGRRGAGQGGLRGELAARLSPVDGCAQVDGGVDGRRDPHRVGGGGCDRLPLQGEEERNGTPCQHPAGVPQANLIRHQHEDGARERAVAQFPHPPGEACPVGGKASANDADGAPVGKVYGGVQGSGAVPVEAQGIGDVGDGRGQPVDGGEGIEPLHEDAPPCAGDGVAMEEFVRADTRLIY